MMNVVLFFVRFFFRKLFSLNFKFAERFFNCINFVDVFFFFFFVEKFRIKVLFAVKIKRKSFRRVFEKLKISSRDSRYTASSRNENVFVIGGLYSV